MGWLFDRQGQAAYDKFARDLVEDRGFRIINALFPVWVAAGIAVPAALGWLIDGTFAGAVTGALWGGAVRIFLLHHVTHGLRWWEVDPTAWVIRAMKATRLAWNVVEISPERQQQKLSPTRL